MFDAQLCPCKRGCVHFQAVRICRRARLIADSEDGGWWESASEDDEAGWAQIRACGMDLAQIRQADRDARAAYLQHVENCAHQAFTEARTSARYPTPAKSLRPAAR